MRFTNRLQFTPKIERGDGRIVSQVAGIAHVEIPLSQEPSASWAYHFHASTGRYVITLTGAKLEAWVTVSDHPAFVADLDRRLAAANAGETKSAADADAAIAFLNAAQEKAEAQAVDFATALRRP